MNPPAYAGEVPGKRVKESVWDYPRPPRVEPIDRRVRVILGRETIAESDRALRVLETARERGTTPNRAAVDLANQRIEEIGNLRLFRRGGDDRN